VSTSVLIGAQYGSIAELQGKTLAVLNINPADAFETTLDSLEQSTGAGEALAQASDNRNLVDDNTAQKLTKADIDKMKDAGRKGEEILKVRASPMFERISNTITPGTNRK
jgi:hypothetical protein